MAIVTKKCYNSNTPQSLSNFISTLDMPVLGVKSNAKPSTYGYPAPLEEKKKEDKEKVATAVLSTTNKQKKKDAEKRKEHGKEVLNTRRFNLNKSCIIKRGKSLFKNLNGIF